jgi:hypothetical protein
MSAKAIDMQIPSRIKTVIVETKISFRNSLLPFYDIGSWFGHTRINLFSYFSIGVPIVSWKLARLKLW